MDYFNYVFTTFLGLEHISCIVVYEDEQRSYGLGTTRGQVINDRIFIVEGTVPLI